MLHTAMDVAVMAQDQVNTGGATSWIKDNIFSLLMLAIACVLGGGALKGNFARVFTIFSLALIAVLWITIATTGKTEVVGQWMMSLIGLG